jgi:hypothetical protein
VSGLSVLFIGCLSATATGAAAVVAITGAAAFCCLACALSGLVGNVEAAGPVLRLSPPAFLDWPGYS